MVLVAGGYRNGIYLERAELFNPTTGNFTCTGSLNIARNGHTATLLNNGTLLVVGGYNSSGSIASAELYNSNLDDDSQFSRLNGGNTFTGNQAVNGTVTATNFVGDGSGLTGITLANANTANTANFATTAGTAASATNALSLVAWRW